MSSFRREYFGYGVTEGGKSCAKDFQLSIIAKVVAVWLEGALGMKTKSADRAVGSTMAVEKEIVMVLQMAESRHVGSEEQRDDGRTFKSVDRDASRVIPGDMCAFIRSTDAKGSSTKSIYYVCVLLLIF